MTFFYNIVPRWNVFYPLLATSHQVFIRQEQARMANPAVIVEKNTEQDGHVLTVTLNRPEKKNAVNCEVMCRLYDAWVELDGIAYCVDCAAKAPCAG